MRRWIVALLMPAALVATACAEPQQPPSTYVPQVGQAGKDVIWVPTTIGLTEAMLTAAEVGPKDLVVDLGSGDGRIVITAAQKFGARARGVEFNPDLVALARENAARAGVADKTTFQQGDIFATDFSDATVVTLYLLPALNLKLRPKLLEMRPGTRIVSNTFDMQEWSPDQRINVEDGHSGYLWIVPARMEGRWRIAAPSLPPGGELQLTQAFQVVRGESRFGGTTASIGAARLSGAHLSFTLPTPQGAWAVVGDANGDGFVGVATSPAGRKERFEMTRVRS